MQPVALHDYAGKVVIITSFPSVDTRVCAAQTRAFNQRAAGIPGVQVLTVSADLPFALERFCAAEGIERVRTLSDHRSTDYALKYGMLIEELRLLARATVIVDQAGVVRTSRSCRSSDRSPTTIAPSPPRRHLPQRRRLAKRDDCAPQRALNFW